MNKWKGQYVAVIQITLFKLGKMCYYLLCLKIDWVKAK